MTDFFHTWNDYSSQMAALLSQLEATDAGGQAMPVESAFQLWLEATLRVRAQKGEVLFVGNGASASMGSHCAADIMKNGRVRTRTCTDMSMLTALSNDISFLEAFSCVITQCMEPGDMLVAISSSGASPNILASVRAAKNKGARVMTLSGFAASNPLRTMGDINFYVPSTTYGLTENCHAVVLHYWMDNVIAIS